MEGEAKAMKAWWTPVMTKGRRLRVRAANRKPVGFIAFNLATFNSAVLYIHTLGRHSTHTHTHQHTHVVAHTESTKGCRTGHLLRSWGKYTGQTEHCVFTDLESGTPNIASFELLSYSCRTFLFHFDFLTQYHSLHSVFSVRERPGACQN